MLMTINIDEAQVMAIVKERVQQLTDEAAKEMVLWDSKELRRRTCLSWNTIQDTFFFDPRFPKKKVGGKWLFPARETRAFLERWMSEQ